MIRWIVGQAVLLVLFSPWLVLSFRGAAEFAAESSYAPQRLGTAAKAAYLAFALCVGETVSPLNVLLVGISFAGFAGAFALAVGRCVRRERSTLLYLGAPIAGAFSTGLLFPAGAPKHLVVMLPALVLFLAVGIARARPSWMGWLFMALIVAACGTADLNYFAGRQFAHADMVTPWRRIAEQIEAGEDPDDRVLVGWRTRRDRFGSDRALLQRYFRSEEETQVDYLPEERWRDRIADVVAARGRVWLLLHREEPREEIEQWLREQDWQVEVFPFQLEEKTLARLKEGGPAEAFESYMFKLYRVTGGPEALQPETG